ncbi:hypothetical protein V8C42DRAFT_206196 [Trichoderma barbatum]
MEKQQDQAPGTASRRQALNACNACRVRKTKCDENKPSCGRCMRLKLSCTYVETFSSRKQLSVDDLKSSLKRMENKLDSLVESAPQQHWHWHGELTGHDSIATSDDSQKALCTPTTISPSSPLNLPKVDFHRIKFELAIPEQHSTAPQHLLTWPCCPLRFSYLELQYPLNLETQRPKLPKHTNSPVCLAFASDDNNWLLHLSLSHLRQLADHYFAHFHPPYLILDEIQFYNHNLSQALRSNFQNGLNSCLVLLVFALGSIAAYHTGNYEWATSNSANITTDVGLGFFNLAKQIFQDAEAVDWVSVQCLLLMGQFYSAKLHVHASWRAIHQACCTTKILLSLRTPLKTQHYQLYWVGYLLESQILAEFNFPPSGLSSLENAVPLPVVPDSGAEPHHQEYHFFFLALVALRKLLNRIHVNLYKDVESSSVLNEALADGPTSTSQSHHVRNLEASRSVVSELDRQLEGWRACLPSPLQFPEYSPSMEANIIPPGERRTPLERLKSYLQARYFAAKSVIHRPSLYRALHRTGPSSLSDEDKQKAHTAISTALLYVLYSGMLTEPLVLLVHPINSCRTFYAAALLINFLLRGGESCQFALPNGWEIIHEVQEQVALMAAPMSPCVARDCEILRKLR